jgi:uncharacterized lipoprotein YmbA
MRTLIVVMLLAMTGCASGGFPQGAVAGCGEFAAIGTFTKTEARGKALWLSDSELAARLTVADVIALAESMGCNSN